MPRVELLLFKELDGAVPLLTWLDALGEKPRGACFVLMEKLETWGHELRRPHTENLGSGIYELRTKIQGVNYRMLYFFHGQAAVVVSHGFTKQRAKIPRVEIERALRRKVLFEIDPVQHTYRPER